MLNKRGLRLIFFEVQKDILYEWHQIDSVEQIEIDRTWHIADYQNYPNPFNPITSIRYDLSEDAFVNITVYDMLGNVIKTLVNGSRTAGSNTVEWDATNTKNKTVSAGLYVFAIQSGELKQTKKMLLVK